MKWTEKSKRSEATLTTHMKHEDDYRMNEDSNLSHSVRASNKEDTQRTTTLTDNKKERLRKRRVFNAWWPMHWHQLRSQIPQLFQVTSHTVGFFSLCKSCHQFNCCRCTHSFNFWPVREFLAEIHNGCCLCRKYFNNGWKMPQRPLPLKMLQHPHRTPDPIATK